jgi:hypothetical protein
MHILTMLPGAKPSQVLLRYSTLLACVPQANPHVYYAKKS